MPRIVTMGGGTGQPTLLYGLKGIPDFDITAVVTSSDSGGSSEKLRRERKVLPPGDLIRCMLALATVENDVVQLFEYRPPGGGIMGGHRIGNFLLTAAVEQSKGNSLRGLEKVAKILRPRGHVLPVTIETVTLCAKFENNEVVRGEHLIDTGDHNGEGRIIELWLERDDIPNGDRRKRTPTAVDQALKAIRRADVVVVGPGDLYTSVLPTVLIPTVGKALRERRGLLVIVTNIMTKRVETAGFHVQDFVTEFERYSGCKIDMVLCNSECPEKGILARYEEEGAMYVEPLLVPNCDWEGRKIVTFPLLAPGVLARHHPTRMAYMIRALL